MGFHPHDIDKTSSPFLLTKRLFALLFLELQFSKEKRSILPVGDITETIPDEMAEIAILEEPEHLTWYHHGRRWKTKFWRVIGVIHTNYLEYVKRERKMGRFKPFC